jgi:hypothetical protein
MTQTQLTTPEAARSQAPVGAHAGQFQTPRSFDSMTSEELHASASDFLRSVGWDGLQVLSVEKSCWCAAVVTFYASVEPCEEDDEYTADEDDAQFQGFVDRWSDA